MSKRILVFGRTGQLGMALSRMAWPDKYEVEFLDRSESDLERPARAAAAIERAKPDLVINAAAYTAVDRAESEFDKARTVNALSPAAMAKSCAELQIPLITFSTDYVFDGQKKQEYVETDPVNPVSAYGRTKEEGERLVRLANRRHLILRTSWVYSADGVNFVRTMLRLGTERPVVRVVSDQFGKPTFADDLAHAAVAAAGKLLAGEELFGTYHVTGQGSTSWHGFAVAIFAGARDRGWKYPQKVDNIATAEFPTTARRPANSRLSAGRFAHDFGLVLPPWQASLAVVLDRLTDRKSLHGAE